MGGILKASKEPFSCWRKTRSMGFNLTGSLKLTCPLLLLQRLWSSKSDVWSFGVTMWEIFTYCQEQPLADLNEDQVGDNLKHWFHSDGFGLTPRRPTLHQCSKEMFDLIKQCWSREPEERPLFMEIHQFLQNKCLGFSVDWIHLKYQFMLFFLPYICDKLVHFPILWMCVHHLCVLSPQ